MDDRSKSAYTQVDFMIRKYAVLTLVGFLGIAGSSFAQQPSLSELLNCSGEAAQTPFCRDQSKAADLRGQYALVFNELKDVIQPPWDEDELAKATALSDEAEALTNDQYFGDAIPKLEEALAILNGLEVKLQQTVEADLEFANTLMEDKRLDEARGVYQKILSWHPDRADIQAKLTELDERQTIESLLDVIARKIDLGETDSAMADLQSVSQSRRNDRWRNLLERIEGPRREARFQEHVSKGIEYRDQGELEKAQTSFAAALKFKPKSTLVSELHADVEVRIVEAELASLRSRIQTALIQEDWIASSVLLKDLIGRLDDPVADEVRLSLAQERINLERNADRLLSYKETGLTRSRRGEIRDFLSTTAAIDMGVRIAAKVSLLEQLLEEWSIPILVTLNSDNKTEVRVRPGRSLGKFKIRKVEMLPGSYRISGIRAGYHEVVHQIDLKPQQNPMILTVECRERF